MAVTSQPSSARRRQLLKAAAGAGVLGALQRSIALAQGASDYRALVCIFQFGGNDGENTLVRFDNAGYQNYAAIRTPASQLNIPQGQLLPIQPLRGGTPFGFHPACGNLQALFNSRKLAVVANMGILAQPSTKAGLESGGTRRPANLFSHSDQELAVQSADWRGATRVGWGGLIADKLDVTFGGSLFPSLVAVGKVTTQAAGRTSVPLGVPESSSFSAWVTGQFDYDSLRDAAMRELLNEDFVDLYSRAAQRFAQDGFSASSVVQPIFDNPGSMVKPFFAGLNSSIAKQLRNVALMIEGRAQIGLKRQVFLTNQLLYDTHGNQLAVHNILLDDLSRALGAFQNAMTALGLADNVTTFTLSEMGRTFKPAANAGTDHGWGNYAFVLGGAVKGGDFYGTLPTQALNGPDDFGKEGRWIPTTSVEQYGATLVRWLGIAEADLPYVFPNIGAFGNTNMGFMA